MALRIKRNSDVPKIEEKTDYRARGNSHIGTPCSASPDATTKILSTHLEHDLLERCSSIKEDKYIELLTTLRKSVRIVPAWTLLMANFGKSVAVPVLKHM